MESFIPESVSVEMGSSPPSRKVRCGESPPALLLFLSDTLQTDENERVSVCQGHWGQPLSFSPTSAMISITEAELVRSDGRPGLGALRTSQLT